MFIKHKNPGYKLPFIRDIFNEKLFYHNHSEYVNVLQKG